MIMKRNNNLSLTMGRGSTDGLKDKTLKGEDISDIKNQNILMETSIAIDIMQDKCWEGNVIPVFGRLLKQWGIVGRIDLYYLFHSEQIEKFRNQEKPTLKMSIRRALILPT